MAGPPTSAITAVDQLRSIHWAYNSHLRGWTLAGNPFYRPIAIDGVRIETETDSTCEAPSLCDLDLASAESLVLSTAFEYDGTAYQSKSAATHSPPGRQHGGRP